MAMEASEIERMIVEALPDARVTIEDLRGDGDHYAEQGAAKDGSDASRSRYRRYLVDEPACIQASPAVPQTLLPLQTRENI